MKTIWKIIAATILPAAIIITKLDCGSVAPALLQGAAAMAVKGEATIVLKNGARIKLTKNLKITADRIILPGSSLITGPNSSVDLVFTDSIKMRVGANSSVTLDISRLLKDRNFTQIKMRLNKGLVYAATGGKLPKNSSFAISTLQSIINVRGTEFVLEETGSSNNIIVSDGVVAVTDFNGNSSASVEEGKSASIAPTGRADVNVINTAQNDLLKSMKADLASLTDEEKKLIKDIADTNEENRRLIKEAYEAQKNISTAGVANQKQSDIQNVNSQNQNNLSEEKKLKSSTKEELQKIKNSVKIKG